MSKRKALAILKAPGMPPVIMHIGTRLEDFHRIINCDCVEVIRPIPENPNIIAIIDGEGKLKNKKPNLLHGLSDVLVGSVIFLGADGPEERGLKGEEFEDVVSHIESNDVLALKLMFKDILNK